MHRQMKMIAMAVTLVSLLGVRVGAEEGKAAAPPPGVTQIGAPRIQTLKGITYFYSSVETDFDHLGERIKALIPSVAKAAGTQIMGPPVLIYHGVKQGDRKAAFKLDVGFVVSSDAKAVGDFKVKALGEFHCLSLLYTGAETAIGAAYEPLMARAATGDVQPTDESRQMFLYWEGPDGPNNIALVAVGLK